MTTRDSLRVATFNIRHGAPEDSYRGRSDLLMDACVELDADILALQEVDAGVARSGFINQAHLVAAATGMEYVFARARLHQFYGPYGNALLVRGGALDDVEILPLYGDRRHEVSVGRRRFELLPERRNAIIASVAIGGLRLAVAATHTGGTEPVRRGQLSAVAAALDRRPGSHLLLGDLNTGHRRTQQWLEPFALTVPPHPPTCPASAPSSAIDHLAVRGLRCLSIETQPLPVSDHLALVAELRPDTP